MPILNTFTSAAARAFKSVVSSVIDPFFSSVGLLLHGDLFGTTNQNNTFLDSSSNNFAITNIGVAQGSFSPYSPSGNYDPTIQGGSGYFNGTTNYLTISNSSAGITSGDFTIECWIFTSDTSFQIIAGTVSGGLGFGYNIDNSTQGLWLGRVGVGPNAISGVQLTYNQWNHVAVTRSSGNVRFFVNGTQTGSTTASNNTYTTCGYNVGRDLSAAFYYNGYISNLRVVKGTAVYTSNFTPPTSPVGNISGTAALLNFANAAAYDASAKTNLATFANAAVSSVQKKFGTGSLYLDGSSHFQYTEQSSTFIGSGDFTVELWAYKTVNTISRLFTSNSSFFIQDFSFNKTGLWWSFPETLLGEVPQLPLNTWTHVAVTRQGNIFRLFVNGVQSLTVTSSLTTATPGIGYIGTANTGTSEFFNGYIDEFRLTKGVARYTASFTVPDAPYPNSFGAASSWSMFSTGTSNDFDGIYLNNQTDFAFGTGDFTIEFFVNLSSSGSNQVLYDSRPSGTNGAYTSIYLDAATTKIYFYTNSSNVISQSSTFTYNTWHHIVATRTGTNTKLFIDGVQEGSTYIDNSNYLIGAGRPFTGNGNTPPVSGIVGYVSNLRVVKGSGPYQGAGSTILVPTSPLTSVPNTVLLTLNSEAFIDLNTVLPAKTINLFNNPTMVRFAPF